jgi:hypothetical protein
MTTNNTPIVSIFNERGNAERAIEDLYNAGIPSDQISYSRGSMSTNSSGGFLESIKHLFTVGHDRTSVDVLNDLNNMGIPQEEAKYYAQQYDAGRTIVTVQQETMNQNALTILRSNGGYDYQGNWNRASSDKFADPASNTATRDNTSGSQNFNQPTTPTSNQTAAYNNQVSDATTPNRNFAGTEAGTYKQDTTSPAFTSQRRYADPNQQGFNNPNQGQQTYADPSQQGFNNPNQQTYVNPNQQAYANPNQQGFNNPNQQAYANPNQQGFNNPNQGQQTYVDPNQQGFNNPNTPDQQAYTDPAAYNNRGMNNPAYINQQAYANPPQAASSSYNQNANTPNPANQQAYTDSTQPASASNQGINAPQNQPQNPNAPRMRTERGEVKRNPDQDYEREQRNVTDQNNM